MCGRRTRKEGVGGEYSTEAGGEGMLGIRRCDSRGASSIFGCAGFDVALYGGRDVHSVRSSSQRGFSNGMKDEDRRD